MEQKRKRCTAIVLAAGSGSRMKSKVAKQYMLLEGKPLICYALSAIETSSVIDDCILVGGKEDLAYIEKEIVEHYNFRKVDRIIAGGTERFLSVGNALRVIKEGEMSVPNKDGYVFIHDGARPFLTEEILERIYEAVKEYHACVAATPSKDTVKIADDEGFAVQTPDRRTIWNVQTPQAFDVKLMLDAYDKLWDSLAEKGKESVMVTDDAGVVERFTNQRVRLVESDYSNIKITTPEDIGIAEALCRQYLQYKR